MEEFTLEQRLSALRESLSKLTKRPEILSIDDNADDLFLAGQVLGKFGNVTSVQKAEEGVARMITGAYDVAFVDLKMLGMTGAEVIRKVQAVKPNQRFVIVTGCANEMICQDMLVAGAVRVLEKPLTEKSVGSIFR